jgi:hypothetical protein
MRSAACLRAGRRAPPPVEKYDRLSRACALRARKTEYAERDCSSPACWSDWGRRRQTAAQGLARALSKILRMAEESLKDELRAALSRRPLRQPRNLLTGPATEAEDEKKSPRARRPGLVARVFRRR